MTRTTDISITDIRNLLGLYVDVTTTNEVVVIDSNNLEIAKRIPTGNAPFWSCTRKSLTFFLSFILKTVGRKSKSRIRRFQVCERRNIMHVIFCYSFFALLLKTIVFVSGADVRLVEWVIYTKS